MESPAKTPATQQQSILRLSVDNELRRRSESNALVFFRISNACTVAVWRATLRHVPTDVMP